MSNRESTTTALITMGIIYILSHRWLIYLRSRIAYATQFNQYTLSVVPPASATGTTPSTSSSRGPISS